MEKDHPTLGWYYNLYMDPKERVPTTMTWANAAVPEPSAVLLAAFGLALVWRRPRRG
jgi:hypothetical protein